MKDINVKRDRFERLAQLRVERVIKDIQLIGNLGNRNNYEFKDEEIKAVFALLKDELKIAESRFLKNSRKRIIFK